jgi:hypothetical protein
MMVAYSFHKRFVSLIQSGIKRHTIRPHRKRHARPGEALQLYTGMRTKACMKILAADPVCERLDEVRLDLRWWPYDDPPASSHQVQGLIPADPVMSINGMPLDMVMRNRVAIADGFEGFRYFDGAVASPFADMLFWWIGTHGPVLFDGVMISWEQAP